MSNKPRDFVFTPLTARIFLFRVIASRANRCGNGVVLSSCHQLNPFLNRRINRPFDALADARFVACSGQAGSRSNNPRQMWLLEVSVYRTIVAAQSPTDHQYHRSSQPVPAMPQREGTDQGGSAPFCARGHGLCFRARLDQATACLRWIRMMDFFSVRVGTCTGTPRGGRLYVSAVSSICSAPRVRISARYRTRVSDGGGQGQPPTFLPHAGTLIAFVLYGSGDQSRSVSL